MASTMIKSGVLSLQKQDCTGHTCRLTSTDDTVLIKDSLFVLLLFFFLFHQWGRWLIPPIRMAGERSHQSVYELLLFMMDCMRLYTELSSIFYIRFLLIRPIRMLDSRSRLLVDEVGSNQWDRWLISTNQYAGWSIPPCGNIATNQMLDDRSHQSVCGVIAGEYDTYNRGERVYEVADYTNYC